MQVKRNVQNMSLRFKELIVLSFVILKSSVEEESNKSNLFDSISNEELLSF